jgi:chaperonin GroES
MSFCHNILIGIIVDMKKKIKKIKISMKILHDNVLVLPSEAETLTKGGIIIPSTAKEKPIKGRVISVGPGKKDEGMELREGDLVLYAKHKGVEVVLDETSYILLKQNDIYCVLS